MKDILTVFECSICHAFLDTYTKATIHLGIYHSASLTVTSNSNHVKNTNNTGKTESFLNNEPHEQTDGDLIQLRKFPETFIIIKRMPSDSVKLQNRKGQNSKEAKSSNSNSPIVTKPRPNSTRRPDGRLEIKLDTLKAGEMEALINDLFRNSSKSSSNKTPNNRRGNGKEVLSSKRKYTKLDSSEGEEIQPPSSHTGSAKNWKKKSDNDIDEDDNTDIENSDSKIFSQKGQSNSDDGNIDSRDLTNSSTSSVRRINRKDVQLSKKIKYTELDSSENEKIEQTNSRPSSSKNLKLQKKRNNTRDEDYYNNDIDTSDSENSNLQSTRRSNRKAVRRSKTKYTEWGSSEEETRKTRSHSRQSISWSETSNNSDDTNNSNYTDTSDSKNSSNPSIRRSNRKAVHRFERKYTELDSSENEETLQTKNWKKNGNNSTEDDSTNDDDRKNSRIRRSNPKLIKRSKTKYTELDSSEDEVTEKINSRSIPSKNCKKNTDIKNDRYFKNNDIDTSDRDSKNASILSIRRSNQKESVRSKTKCTTEIESSDDEETQPTSSHSSSAKSLTKKDKKNCEEDNDYDSNDIGISGSKNSSSHSIRRSNRKSVIRSKKKYTELNSSEDEETRKTITFSSPPKHQKKNTEDNNDKDYENNENDSTNSGSDFSLEESNNSGEAEVLESGEPKSKITTNHSLITNPATPTTSSTSKSWKALIASKKFWCRVCDHTIRIRSDYLEHMSQKHSKNGKYPCTHCHKRTKSIKKFNAHMDKHLNPRSLMNNPSTDKRAEARIWCRYCEIRFPKMNPYLNHMKRKHLKDDKYTCSHCPESFSKIKAFNFHFDKHFNPRSKLNLKIPKSQHPDDPESGTHPGAKTHPVALAGMSIGRVRKYKEYTVVRTSKVKNSEGNWEETKISIKVKALDPPSSNSLLNGFTCRICETQFLMLKEYKEHMVNEHLKDGQYTCPYCQGKYFPMNAFTDHILAVHKNNHKCEICSKVMQSELSMALHMKGHEKRSAEDPKKPFVCSICKHNFSRIDHLRKHFMKHLENNPFKCKFTGCERTFTSDRNLSRHVLRHTERYRVTFNCEHCTAKYDSKSQLNAHQRKFHSKDSTKVPRLRRKVKFIRNIYEDPDPRLHQFPLKNTETVDADKRATKDPESTCNDKDEFRVELESIHLTDQVITTDDKTHDDHYIKGERLSPKKRPPTSQPSFSRSTLPNHENFEEESSQELDNSKQLDLLEIIASDPVVKRIEAKDPTKKLSIIRSMFPNRFTNNEQSRIKCPICSWSCVRTFMLKYHYIRYHGETQSSKLGLPSSVPTEKNPLAINLVCGSCGYHSESVKDLSTHISKVHVGKNKFHCSFCGIRFSKKSRKDLHERTIHLLKKKFLCQKCDIRFATRRTLNKHLKVKHDPNYKKEWKSFKCNKCEKAFNSKFNLDKHSNLHTAARDLSTCKICGQICANTNTLKRHIQYVHMGVKNLYNERKKLEKLQSKQNRFQASDLTSKNNDDADDGGPVNNSEKNPENAAAPSSVPGSSGGSSSTSEATARDGFGKDNQSNQTSSLQTVERCQEKDKEDSTEILLGF